MNRLRIVMDAHGGDLGAAEVVKGAVMAVKEYGCDIILAGEEDEISRLLSSAEPEIKAKISIVPARNTLTMEDEPKSVLKEKRDSSMGVALSIAAEGGADACVSAGNTGALVMGGTFIVKRIPGVSRAAFGALLPVENGVCMLLDMGANAECKPEMLCQFAKMGSLYMNRVMHIENPRVGLLNIGVEEHKGTELYVQAHKLMRENGGFNFIGNVEGRDFPKGVCDVLVCDGFTGNITLKVFEGVALSIYKSIKGVFLRNGMTKLAALICKGGLMDFKKQMDYKEYGGAPLLGLRVPVIKAHGSSDARAFKNAVRQAVNYINTGMISELEKSAAKEKTEE